LRGAIIHNRESSNRINDPQICTVWHQYSGLLVFCQEMGMLFVGK
jgi:hypothetical protein